MPTRRLKFALLVLPILLVLGLAGLRWYLHASRSTDADLTKPLRPTASGASTAAPVVRDDQASAHFQKLVHNLLAGTPEQKSLAADALRLAPATALPILKSAASASDAPPELKAIYAAQVAARKRFADMALAEAAYTKSLLAAYDKVGDHDAAWDNDARALLTGVYITPRPAAELQALITRLAAAPCTDPFVKYAGLTVSPRGTSNYAEQLNLIDDLVQHNYPDSLVLYAIGFTADAATTPPQKFNSPPPTPAPDMTDPQLNRLRSRLNQAMSQLANITAEHVVPFRLEDIFYNLVLAQAVVDDLTIGDAWDKLEPKFNQQLPNNPFVKLTGSVACGIQGTQDRGGGVVGETPQAQMTIAMNYFARSESYAEQALALDPGYARAVRQRLQFMRYRGADRQEVDTWFRKGIELDPDSPTTIRQFAEMSMRRWTGDADWEKRVWRVGQVAVLSRNFAAKIPQQIEVVLRVTNWDLPPDKRTPFFHSDAVRAVVRYTFDEAIRVSPTQDNYAMALPIYFSIGDTASARQVLELLPPNYVCDANWYGADVWPKMKRQILASQEPIPHQPPPTWVP